MMGRGRRGIEADGEEGEGGLKRMGRRRREIENDGEGGKRG